LNQTECLASSASTQPMPAPQRSTARQGLAAAPLPGVAGGAAAQRAGEPYDILPQLLGRTALVVEDDAFVRHALARQLSALGVGTVVTAADGLEAVRLLRNSATFALVICDLCLPGADGVELVRELAHSQPRAALLLISSKDRKVLSAVSGVARTHRLNLLGALEKPVTTEALRALLSQAATTDPVSVPRSPPAFTPAELRDAIVRGEINIHVQPKLHAVSGELVGVEALARWFSPACGLVPPSAFVKVAERHGLIDDLTDLVLDRSLAACGAWKRQGLETCVAVNMPVSSAQRLDLPERIESIAGGHGVLPEQLIVEITESGLAEDPRKALDVLSRLRLHGVSLALDDFGCGYSSMQQLNDLPFDRLKLDQAFVRAAIVDPEMRSIVKSSIQLARELGLKTVAEGVETRELWDMMIGLGCDMVQGYFIARPFAADRLPAWWQQNAARFR